MKLRAKVQNYKLIFDQDESWLRNAFFKLEGKNVIVDVEQVRSIRSINQNSYYWLILDVIASDIGESSEHLHAIFKGLYAPKVETKLNGKTYNIPMSTTEMSKGQFVEYLMHISAQAGELGIILPDPELYGSEL